MVPMRDANAPVVNSPRALVIRHWASLTERVGALSALVLSLSEATGPAAAARRRTRSPAPADRSVLTGSASWRLCSSASSSSSRWAPNLQAKHSSGRSHLLCADYARPGTRNPSIRGSTTSTSGRSFPPEQRQVNPRSPRSGRGSEGTFALKFPVPISACLPILIKPPGKPSVRTRVESEGCALDLCCRRSTLRGSVRGSG